MSFKPAFIIAIGLVLGSCAQKYQQFIPAYHFEAKDGKPDYSNMDYWAAHPGKKDPSDSLPKPLKGQNEPDTAVDVFFIHPTSYTQADYPFGYNAPIDNAAINAKTDYGSILYQASIFNNAGLVYAPRYRQANYWCYFPTDSAAAAAAFQLAYDDVRTAFLYYLSHYNRGRPIIIAAHSQGTTHAITLLREFFDGQPLQQQLVAAYLVGMAVKPGDFAHIHACNSPAETGCFCSWRTMQTGYLTPFVKNEKFTAIVTNPLTWDSSKPSAPRSENPGAVLTKFSRLKAHLTNAVIHEGVLWSNKPRFFGNIFLHLRNYHIADYNFFYLSVRRNAEERAAAYIKSHRPDK